MTEDPKNDVSVNTREGKVSAEDSIIDNCTVESAQEPNQYNYNFPTGAV